MAGFAKGLIHGGLIGSAGVLALALALPPAGDSPRADGDGAQVADDAARVTQADSGKSARAMEAGAGAVEGGGSALPAGADTVEAGTGDAGSSGASEDARTQAEGRASVRVDPVETGADGASSSAALESGGAQGQSGGSAHPAEASDPALASDAVRDPAAEASPARGAVVEFTAPRGSEFARPDPHRLPSLPADAAPPETGRRAALPDAPEAESAPASPDRADPPGPPAIPGPLPETVAQSHNAPTPQAGEEQATPRVAAPALAAAPGRDAALPPETAQSPAPPEPAARTADPQAAPPVGPGAEPALPQAVAQGETPRADSPALVQAAPEDAVSADDAVPANDAAARPGDIGTAPAMPQIGASAGGNIPQLPSGGSAPQRSAAPQLDTPRPVAETVPPPPPAADETAEPNAGDPALSQGAVGGGLADARENGSADGATSSQVSAGEALRGRLNLDDASEDGSGEAGHSISQSSTGAASPGGASVAETTGTEDQRQPSGSAPRPVTPRPIAPDLSVPHLNGLGL